MTFKVFCFRLLAFVVLAAFAASGVNSVHAEAAPENVACPAPGSGQAIPEGCEPVVEVVILTFAGPANEQVAVFCVGSEATFAVRIVEMTGETTFADAPGTVPCDPTAVGRLMLGYRLVFNTSPLDGWTIVSGPWLGVEQCFGNTLIEVWVDDKGRRDLDQSMSVGCDTTRTP
jgi:hypothetical protein